ncbi:hypothetical protein ANN_04952 [Periplaneta americana]|uniref:Uncharacterized protein n=1 Tax=Periplaneta americana TaxID=6978 RepID=A0ABQ8TBE7_PERAM|nr:hypothetical protein ANN_04952 [Periplaneta americana]
MAGLCEGGNESLKAICNDVITTNIFIISITKTHSIFQHHHNTTTIINTTTPPLSLSPPPPPPPPPPPQVIA